MDELRKRSGPRESGQVLVVSVLVMTVLIGFMALTIDVGLAFWQKRDLQNAVDAAGLAAAQDMLNDESIATATASALEYLQRNGYDTTNATIDVNVPPLSGPHQGDVNYVEVIVSTEAPFAFLMLFRDDPYTVNVRAVAGNDPVLAIPFSFMSLRDDCEKHTLLLNAGGSLTVEGGIHVNSCNTEKGDKAPGYGDAFDIFGGGFITADEITVVGGWEVHDSTGVSPDPLILQPARADPLVGLMPPDITSLPVQSGSPSDPEQLKIDSDTTLLPGVYYGGIKVEDEAEVVMQPGIYYIAGGGFELRDDASLNAPNVMIYNSDDPFSSSKDGEFDNIKLDTKGDVTLGPLTGGPYAGLTIFQDRDNERDLTFEAGNGINGISGTIYAPNDEAKAVVSGGGEANLQLITGMILIEGADVTFRYQTEGLYGSSFALVE
jgi:Flp pilus assembly protein TadG